LRLLTFEKYTAVEQGYAHGVQHLTDPAVIAQALEHERLTHENQELRQQQQQLMQALESQETFITQLRDFEDSVKVCMKICMHICIYISAYTVVYIGL